ncbi:MAG: sulfite exporter TauE/SafE family protein [Opitutaceae bacterium]|jgi:hypothetical protein
MELAGITTPAAAFVAGLVTSLHCAGMCGPIACMLAPARDDRADPHVVATVYHVARVASYALIGAIAGAAGGAPMALLGSSASRVLPWALVVFLLLVAFRVDKRLPKPAFFLRMQWRLRQALQGRSRLRVAAVMGAATPLLPCGPLYFLIALAAMSGSAVRGVEFMLAFGFGTVPLLWLMQSNYGLLSARFSPVWLARFQAGLALAAALMMVWRLRGSLGFDGPGIDHFICH